MEKETNSNQGSPCSCMRKAHASTATSGRGNAATAGCQKFESPVFTELVCHSSTKAITTYSCKATLEKHSSTKTQTNFT